MYLQVLAQSEVLSVRLKSLTTCWRVTVDPDVGQHVLQFINADIARKDGEQVRLWARTTSDYSNTFTRIRAAVAALPVHSAVLDGEAIVFRSAVPIFEALNAS